MFRPFQTCKEYNTNMYIFSELRKDKAKMSEEHRILILGCGEAGKSTFIKQMEIIHAQGLGDNSARLDKKTLIAGNIVSAMGTLVREMSFVQENQLHDSEELSEAVGRLSSMPNFPTEHNIHAMKYEEKLVLDRADDIKLLWECEPIQTTYKRRNEFQIVECARYFLSKVHEVMQPDYVPSDDDILQIRVQTIGINEHVFQMKGGGANRKLIMVGIRIWLQDIPTPSLNPGLLNPSLFNHELLNPRPLSG